VSGLIDDDEVGHFFVDGRWVGGSAREEQFPALAVGAGSQDARARAGGSWPPRSESLDRQSAHGNWSEGLEGVEASEAGGGGGWKTVGINLSSSGGHFRPSPATVCVSLPLAICVSLPLAPPSASPLWLTAPLCIVPLAASRAWAEWQRNSLAPSVFCTLTPLT